MICLRNFLKTGLILGIFIAYTVTFLPTGWASQEGKVVLITGSFRGLGQSVGDFLREQGYSVVYSGRRLAEAPNFSLLPENLKNRSFAIELDITDPRSIQDGLDLIRSHWGGVDTVIHNAAAISVGSAIHQDAVLFERAQQTNFLGPVALTQALMPEFIQQKKGRIIYISSSGALMRESGFAAYASSKSAAEAWFETLAYELRESAELRESQLFASILRVSFVRGAYQPAIHFGAREEDPSELLETEAFMRWLRDHSPTSEKGVQNALLKMLTSNDPSIVENVGADGVMTAVLAHFPTTIQRKCSWLLRKSLVFLNAMPKPSVLEESK